LPGTITSISVRVQSVLPLPAWETTVSVTLPTPVCVLTITDLAANYYGGNPYSVGPSSGSLRLVGTMGQTTWHFSGVIGDWTVEATFDSAAGEITYLYFVTSLVGYSNTQFPPGHTELYFPKSDTSISVPQLSGTLVYDEDGSIDLMSSPWGSDDEGSNTSRADAGSITIQYTA
jgi:hypothetical protein